MPVHFPSSVILSTGRGRETFAHETQLEPIVPRREEPARSIRLVDDARIPNGLTGIFRPRQAPFVTPERPALNHGSNDRPQPISPARIATFLAYLPVDLSKKHCLTRQAIQSLAFSAAWFGLEVVGTGNEIAYQISCEEGDRASVQSQLQAHLPEIDFRCAADKLTEAFPLGSSAEFVKVDIGLKNTWVLPLADDRELAPDPTAPLMAALDPLSPGEALCLQILISRTQSDWVKQAASELFDKQGKLVFSDLRDHAASIKQKLSAPLLSVCLRAAANGRSRQGSIALARRTGAFFRQFSAASRNEFIPFAETAAGAPGSALRSVMERTTFRSGMLLNAREISSVARFPTGDVLSSKLLRVVRATRQAPSVATTGTITLGENEHAGKTQTVRISPAYHGLVIGGTGTGKSTLLLNSILQIISSQDISSGGGCCVVDPHGDLVDDVIARLPDDRIKDTILFDPSDAAYPVGFNPLQANSETEKVYLESDMVATFRRYSSSWGDVMDSLLSNSIIAFLESSRGGNLYDLRRFLVEKEFRREFLETIEDESVRYFWTHEFPIISGRTQSSILIRLDTFLRQKLVRNVVCQTGSKLNLREIVDGRKIFLIKLSQGLLGEENAWLLGTLLISKIYGIALTRGDVSRDERPLWPVVIDEAAHFSGNPSMSLILENLRKFGISLTLSTQSHKLLMAKAPGVADSALTNCQLRICFRLGDNDAERLAGGFSSFDARALQNLATGEAIMRIEKSENDFNLRTFPAEPVPPDTARRRMAAVVENTRKNYATPVEEVEAQFRAMRTLPKAKPAVIYDPPEPPSRPPFQIQDSSASVESSAPARSGSSSSGRGGRHHQEIQGVIKRMAEVHGFAARIEENVPEGAGRVDVALENESLRIACEVSVTTTDYETHNVQKCLAAGYDHVLVVVSNKKKISLLNAKLDSEIPPPLAARVRVLSLMDLLVFLKEVGKPAASSSREAKRPRGTRIEFADACDLLEKSPSTLYRWVREGRVPFYRVGREYEFDRDELLLLGRQAPLSKRRPKVSLTPLTIDKGSPKTRKQQDDRYRKLLNLDKIDGPLHTRREKEAHDN